MLSQLQVAMYLAAFIQPRSNWIQQPVLSMIGGIITFLRPPPVHVIILVPLMCALIQCENIILTPNMSHR